MKLTCQQDTLKRALATVGHAVPSKSTLPVLSNVLLTADAGCLKLAATDLELAISCSLSARIETTGVVTVPAKLLSEYVGALPSDTLALSLDARTQALQLDCARFAASIKGIEAEEFPVLPTLVEREPTTRFPANLLRTAIDQVAFAAATEDTRPVLAGVLLRLRDTQATFAAADGFRLALHTVELPQPLAEPLEVVVPARALLELGRVISDTEENVAVTVTPSGGQIVFTTDTLELVARLIDGRYPDIERVIPSRFATRTVLERHALLKAIKLAHLFAAASSNIVRLTFAPSTDGTPGTLTISANAAEVGDNRGVLEARISGEGGQIALNAAFLVDAIDAIPTPQIAIETQTSQSPGVLKPIDGAGATQIIMPMTVR
jgi:DNA polymerase III subunit beta